MFDTNTVAKNIKEARIGKNMTQMDLADAMGVSYQAVSNWERGNSMPDISNRHGRNPETSSGLYGSGNVRRTRSYRICRATGSA